jgi:hypothetical protein
MFRFVRSFRPSVAASFGIVVLCSAATLAETPAERAELAAAALPPGAASPAAPLGGIVCPQGTVLTTFYSTDFESGDAGWVESGFGEWERGAPVLGVYEGCDTAPRPEPTGANSGVNVFATNLNGCYANSNSDSILSQTFNFSTLTAPIELRWMHWYEVFETFDFAITRVNGTQVFRTPNATATPAYLQQTADLSALAGNPAVLVEFLLHATTVVNRTGWYLDDIEIRYCAAPVGCSLTCPADQNANTAAGTCAANVNYPAPTTSGTCGTVTCDPASGSSFGLGTTPVSCTSSENGGACAFNVTVADTEAPVVVAPDLSVGTDPGVCTAAVAFGATVSDNCPGAAAATCAPPSGTTFALGVTPVNCSTTDAAGNPGADVGSVTVTDDEAPVLAACPADLFVDLPAGSPDVVVDFVAPAYTDNCAAPGVATCAPPSGSSFPLGTTGVNCSASDSAGNAGSCGFDVTVGGGQSVLEIPTASTLGLVALMLLLAGAAVLALRRRA